MSHALSGSLTCSLQNHFEVPDGRQIKSVEVDGRVWADFDSAKSIVRLKPSAKNIEIRAHY